MQPTSITYATAFASLVLLTNSASGGTIGTFYSIGPDANGVPRDFVEISLPTSSNPAGSVDSLFDLANDLTAFNGGATFVAGPTILSSRFYAISNDSSGNSILWSFSLSDQSSFSFCA